MIVVDTSAVIAYLRAGPEAPAIDRVLASGEELCISAVSVYEASIVLQARIDESAVQAFDLFIIRTGIAVNSFDEAQARLARRAYARFGKGSGHGASLNMGDCAAYALAQSLDAKLLFVGADFAKTDIEPALS